MSARLSSPSTARNREPILAVIAQHFPVSGKVLEIASGAGEHAVFIAKALPGLTWQPSDADKAARESIAAWIAHEKLTNVLTPLAIDVRAADWGVSGPFDAIVAINMIHIAPWDATQALMAGAARVLAPGGLRSSTVPTNGTAHTPRPRMKCSTPRSALAIRSGACAIWRMWSKKRRSMASRCAT
jgi:hypothetical protein